MAAGLIPCVYSAFKKQADIFLDEKEDTLIEESMDDFGHHFIDLKVPYIIMSIMSRRSANCKVNRGARILKQCCAFSYEF